MELTENNIVTLKIPAGLDDWGHSYMRGLDKKGSISWAWWSGRFGSDRLFGQGLLWESREYREVTTLL